MDFGADGTQGSRPRSGCSGPHRGSARGPRCTALVEAADGFTELGLSEGDMLDLEARIIDIGTAAGITDDELGAVGR